MGQIRVHKAKGLKTFKNELTLTEGSLIEADNVVIDRDNVIESRRGFGSYTQDFGDINDRASQLLQYKDTLILHYDDKLLFDDGSGDLTGFDGVYEALKTGLRIKSLESNGNMYFTTLEGVKKISAKSSSEFTDSAGYILDAGAAKALDVETELTGSGYLLDDRAVAYRVIWGYKDVNENLILGSPSAISIARNTSGTTTQIRLKFTIPTEVTIDNDYFYQVYRSPLKDISSDPDAQPEDELRLVFEEFPTSTDFSQGYVSVLDNTSESLRDSGAFLYTNPISGEGILQSNEKPPLCQDVAIFKNSMFYANTKTRHKKNVNMLAVVNISVDDTITIGLVGGASRTYTFKLAEDPVNNEVYLENGSGSPSIDVDTTARSLVRVINRDTSGLVYAYYLSSVNDVPGLMLFESRTVSDDEFYVNCSDANTIGEQFLPKLPESPDETEISDNEEFPNRVYYSKTSEPEAVPIVNYFNVGEKDSEIKRIVALRDSLFIMKDDGIYRLSGSDPTSFVVTLFDSSSPLVAPDSAQVLNNQIYMLTRQGVVTVTDSGVNIISRDIERRLLEPVRANSNFENICFGVSYESDRSYLIWMPEKASDTSATQCYRYNIFTRAWTRWTVPARCGLVLSGEDRIFLGSSDANSIEAERKDYDRSDYADRAYEIQLFIDGIVEDVITLPSVTQEEVGDIVLQNQIITVARFNRLLKKLDKDVYLDDTDYESSLEISAGSSLEVALNALILKVAADDASPTDYAPVLGLPESTIQEIRDKYNALVDTLNSSPGTFYINYRTYDNLIVYEAYITEVNKNTSKITIDDSVPFLAGDYVLYKSIRSEVQWSPQTVDSAGMLKQFREATLMFDDMSFSKGSFIFRSDISDDEIFTEFDGEGNGAYGTQTYGEFTYGGGANQKQMRTYVPRNKQRSRFIILGFIHLIGRENFAITGYSLTYNDDKSERAYRR